MTRSKWSEPKARVAKKTLNVPRARSARTMFVRVYALTIDSVPRTSAVLMMGCVSTAKVSAAPISIVYKRRHSATVIRAIAWLAHAFMSLYHPELAVWVTIIVSKPLPATIWGNAPDLNVDSVTIRPLHIVKTKIPL